MKGKKKTHYYVRLVCPGHTDIECLKIWDAAGGLVGVFFAPDKGEEAEFWETHPLGLLIYLDTMQLSEEAFTLEYRTALSIHEHGMSKTFGAALDKFRPKH